MRGLGPSLLHTEPGPARVTDTKCHDTKGHELGSSLFLGYSITYIHGGHLHTDETQTSDIASQGREGKEEVKKERSSECSGMKEVHSRTGVGLKGV